MTQCIHNPKKHWIKAHMNGDKSFVKLCRDVIRSLFALLDTIVVIVRCVIVDVVFLSKF